jgi:hypothetical protein
MNILYVGNFGVDFSTETHLAKTLDHLGHKVIYVQENAYTPEELMRRIDRADFDLFLFTRTWGKTVTVDILNKLKKLHIPSVSYHLDLYAGLLRDGGLDTDPFWRTDYVFTPDGDPDSAEFFKDKGINHRYLKPGVYAPECYIDPAPLSHDLIFVGSNKGYHPEHPYREQLISWLQRNYKHRFELYGPPPRGTVRGADLNRLYASTKIVIGDSLVKNFTHTYYWSDRVYETMGRGGFIIHPYIKGMEEEFTDGKNIVFYHFGNFKELADKISYYYSHDQGREEIRRAGHEFVKKNCTYTNRLTQMFKVLNEEGAL